jgi:addiction module HigA family antidote
MKTSLVSERSNGRPGGSCSTSIELGSYRISACPRAITWRPSRATGRAAIASGSTSNGASVYGGLRMDPMTSKSSTTTRRPAARRKLLDPIPPGEILREEFLRPLGISINALARDVAVPPNRISAIVNGKRAISADTALRLGKYFGVSPELWLDLQSDYDLRVARRTVWKRVEPRIRVRAA